MKGQVILKNLQWLGRHNPAFPPGSVQTAVAELLNPTSSIQPYSARLCLDKPAIVCTGTKYFNIDAGATKDVNFQILMPTAEGTYPVHLDIFSNSELLEAYRAAEDVVVGLLKYHLSVFVPTWAYGGYVTPSSGDYPANTTVKLTAHPFSGYQFLGWGVDASGTSPTYNLYMNSDKYVEAYFEKVAEPPTYYPCPYCGATFTTMAALTSHIEEYHPPPPVYRCPYCGATFTSQSALDSHIKTVHPPPVYRCPYCGATFTSQSALDSHIATAHPPAPVCKVGDWKCVGRDLYICIEWGTINRWKLIERDSNVCYP